MTTMKHGDYIAKIDFDPDIGMFHGRIINIHSVINFYGKSVEELQAEFESSLQVYLDVCKEKGIDPDKPYSGRFNIRMSPEQHGRFAQYAAKQSKSLNAWALEVMEQSAIE
ncbi:MAG: type II toxin-antitoxin system HicB family antitoxin [Desulfobacterales bacterium]|nr:type II toxin-antitoxin system HicB family antitoxin [Desulfobacterales bacterium]